MLVFNDLEEWQRFRSTLSPSSTLGFVPTMGNLHRGHVSLYEKSTQENSITVASLFINPTQFNRVDDFKHYPRTLEADLALLETVGVDYCLLPNEKAIYPDHYHYQLHEHHLSLLMEGQHRPGHFTGVLTIVMKLLNLVKPKRAYFGEKDYQQLQLIKGMVDAFFMDIEIKACPTIRETSCLAFSSRNNRLSTEQRTLASRFAQIFHQKHKSIDELAVELSHLNIDVEYLKEHQGRRFIAVKIGDIRLIDNYAVA